MQIELNEEEAGILINLLSVAMKSPSLDVPNTFQAAQSCIYFAKKIEAAKTENQKPPVVKRSRKK